jgi:curli biogenesis system outer membrane secretion channel CsgG
MSKRLGWSAVWLVFSLPTVATADYVAYSVDGGQRKPLPESLDSVSAEKLVDLEWGQYAGRRPTVGVLEVENTTSLSSFLVTASSTGDQVLSSVPINGLEAILTDSLSRSGRFRLVERNQLEGVLQEQDLAASGRVTKASGAATGKVLGAEYLVQLVVTDYQPDVEGRDINVGGLLKDKVPALGGFKVKNRKSRVGLNVRLIDAETSEIVFTKQIESEISEKGVAFGGAASGNDLGLGAFLSNFSKTPVGQAAIAGINKGVFELIKQIGAKPAEGSIVTTTGNQVVVNLGTGSAEVGERFQLIHRGEELVDPDTGLSLGTMETVVGEIEIVGVQEKFSTARLLNGAPAPSRGDKVVSTKAPPGLEFASTWSED